MKGILSVSRTSMCAETQPRCFIPRRVRTGELRAKGVTRSANAVLHPWLERELEAMLARLSAPIPMIEASSPTSALALPPNRQAWEAWQAGLSVKFTLPEVLPSLRTLLVLDNRVGHKPPVFVLWLVAQGVMPLYTPLSGS